MRLTTNSLISLMLFVSVLSYGDDLKKRTYYFGSTKYTFVVDRTQEIVISEGCYENMSCEAWQKLSRAKKIELAKEDLSGGANPGAVICTKLDGKIRVYKNVSRDETSFCLFKDKSMVANFSLMSAR